MKNGKIFDGKGDDLHSHKNSFTQRHVIELNPAFWWLGC